VTGLPPIDQSLLPADVRNGSSADRQKYAAALGFERTLVDELTKTMAATAQPVDGSDDGSDGSDGTDGGQPQDAASSMYLQMLPDQLADSITQDGGLGLARGFYDALKDGQQ
jgi:Rod binding domain-containing protein